MQAVRCTRAVVTAVSQRVSVQEIAIMDAGALGRATQRSLSEGDLQEVHWQRYAARAMELAETLSISEAARLATSFSTARLRDFGVFATLSSRSLKMVKEFEEIGVHVSATDLRRFAVAFGRARAFDSELMEALVPHMVECVEDFTPKELARIADAYARMPVQSPELFSVVADALPPYLYDLQPPEIATLCRAFAEAAVYNLELTDALCHEMMKRLKSFGAGECLIFLDGLSRIHVSLPEELRRNDAETVAAIADHLYRCVDSLAVGELIRLFAALVRLDHYNPRLVHRRLCPNIDEKLRNLVGPSSFPRLAELLHCLSLLPAQSQKSAELTVKVIAAMRRGGIPRGRPELPAVALTVSALVQLGHESHDLLEMLAASLQPLPRSASLVGADNVGSSSVDVLAEASTEELQDLQRVFGLCKHAAGGSACAALAEEMERRSAGEPPT